jgi:hypothetical protein
VKRRILAFHMRRRIHACHMRRRRIHACHVKRRILAFHVSFWGIIIFSKET